MATNNAIRLIILRPRSLPRWFSTVTAATERAVSKGKEKEESLYRRLSALGVTKGNASETLDRWVNEGISVKKFNLVNIALQLRKSKEYHHALEIYGWMEKRNVILNSVDYAICIDLIAKTKGIASAENYFNNLEVSGKTLRTYGELLDCYCKENMLEKATEFFETMKELNLVSGKSIYNSMMHLYLRADQPEKVPLLAQEMEENNVAADLYTYNQLMNSYASVKDIEAVEKVLEKMEKNGVKQDYFSYGVLATIYLNAGLIDKANDTLQKLEGMENLRDREAFRILITLYSRMSNLSGVKRAWDSLKLTHPKIAGVSHLILFSALFKLEDFNAVEEYFREWESSCSYYDVRVSNFVLESYLKRDIIEEATVLSENLVKIGVKPNSRTLHLHMNFYLKKKQMDLALQYLEQGLSKAKSINSLFPKDESVGMFLQYFEVEKDVDGAEIFWKIMDQNGRLNMEICHSLRKTYEAAGKKVPVRTNLLSLVNEDGIPSAGLLSRVLEHLTVRSSSQNVS